MNWERLEMRRRDRERKIWIEKEQDWEEREIKHKEWEYRITRCDLGYHIYKKQEGWLIRYLSGNKNWVLKREYARVYFHKEAAISDLVIMKTRDADKEKSD